MTKLIIPWSVVLALTITLGTALHAQSAQPEDQPQGINHTMMARCQQMMAMHQRMHAEMKAQDEELQKLVTTMNNTTGDQKITAMATVINKMVEQHTAMRNRMQEMHQHMMAHMAEHMQMGPGSMSHCPMMHEMMHGGATNNPSGPSPDEHSHHH